MFTPSSAYLVRCAEVGREQQPRLGKLRNDLAATIAERLPGARIEASPGRIIVEPPETCGVLDVLVGLPGVASVSPCLRVAFDDVERAVIAVAERHPAARSFAIRIRRGGPKAGASAAEARPALAARLAAAVTVATGLLIDLDAPVLTIGIELRRDEAFVFDRVVDGVDRAGPTAPRAEGPARFVADQMLGRLAVRLRLLGYDTLGVFDIADSEVTRLAAVDGRILLTRDGPLAQTRAVPVHRVRATSPRQQLAEVMAAFDLDPDPARFFTRCTVCNTPVEPIAEELVGDRLPPSVRGRSLAIVRCPSCDRLYWRGSHVERFLAELHR